jgi:hypothetical protein
MSFEDLFPETLYEANIQKKSVCLVCAKDKATSLLRSTSREVAPICKNCAADWNWYGYAIFKKIRPKQLRRSLVWYKILYWFDTQSPLQLYRDAKKYFWIGQLNLKNILRVEKNDSNRIKEISS